MIKVKGYWRRKPRKHRVNGTGVKRALKKTERIARRSWGLKKRRKR